MRQHRNAGETGAGGVADGGEDGGGGGDQRRLAHALGAEGTAGLCLLDQVGLDGRHVADGGDQVVVQVLGAAGNEFLYQRHAEPLGDATVDLALHQRRIDGAADVVGGDDLDRLGGAERGVDLHFGHLRGEAVGG